AGPQAAYAANDEMDLDARLACLVEHVDDLRIDERIHLGPDGGRTPRLRMLDLGMDVGNEARAHVDRRDGQKVKILRLRISGDVVEDLRRVVSEAGIAGEHRAVGINLRGDRMVVAGAEM